MLVTEDAGRSATREDANAKWWPTQHAFYVVIIETSEDTPRWPASAARHGTRGRVLLDAAAGGITCVLACAGFPCSRLALAHKTCVDCSIRHAF